MLKACTPKTDGGFSAGCFALLVFTCVKRRLWVTRGRFYTQDVRFPKAAFRDLTFSLRGDRSLCIWVISYDLHTLYLERNIYVYGKWLDR